MRSPDLYFLSVLVYQSLFLHLPPLSRTPKVTELPKYISLSLWDLSLTSSQLNKDQPPLFPSRIGTHSFLFSFSSKFVIVILRVQSVILYSMNARALKLQEYDNQKIKQLWGSNNDKNQIMTRIKQLQKYQKYIIQGKCKAANVYGVFCQMHCQDDEAEQMLELKQK